MRETSAARFYELMVIISPEGTPEELIETVDQINGYITTAGGSILRSNSDSPWGRRRLAYPIRHESQDVRDGFYTLIHLELAPNLVIDVERDLKLNERLMRYLVLQLPGEPVFPEPEEETAEAGSAEVEGGSAASTEAGGESTEETASAGGESTAEGRRDKTEVTTEIAASVTDAEGEATATVAEASGEVSASAADAGSEAAETVAEAGDEVSASVAEEDMSAGVTQVSSEEVEPDAGNAEEKE